VSPIRAMSAPKITEAMGDKIHHKDSQIDDFLAGQEQIEP